MTQRTIGVKPQHLPPLDSALVDAGWRHEQITVSESNRKIPFCPSEQTTGVQAVAGKRERRRCGQLFPTFVSRQHVDNPTTPRDRPRDHRQS